MRGKVIMAFMLAVITIPGAQAADKTARVASLHRAARNELGLLRYCLAKGLATEMAVAAEVRIIDALPAAATPGEGELEEAEGRLGYLAFYKRQALFSDSAAAQGLTLAAACEGRAELALTGR